MSPENLKYNESHEWVGLAEESGETIAIIGVTDFALEQLTDLVFLELPQVGTKVVQGEQFGEVESVKAVSPLYSPVSGEVVAAHHEIANHLDSLADDPYENGWLIKVRLSDASELDSLLDHASYVKQISH